MDLAALLASRELALLGRADVSEAWGYAAVERDEGVVAVVQAAWADILTVEDAMPVCVVIVVLDGHCDLWV